MVAAVALSVVKVYNDWKGAMFESNANKLKMKYQL